MAKLRRAEVWTNLKCKSGTRLGAFAALTRCEEQQSLDGNDKVTLEYSADDPAADYVVAGRIIRLDFSDSEFSEWRIQNPAGQFGLSGNRRTVVAVSPLFDLADATIISETQGSGVVDFDIGLFQVTVTEVVDDYIIAKLPTAYNYFARGTVDPTAKFDVQFTKATPLALLQQLAEAARDPVTRRPAEIRVRRNGTTGYYIDVLTEIGSSAAIVDLRSSKQITDHSVSEDATEQVSVVYPFGATESDGSVGTIARAAFTLGTPTGLVYPITDPEGGPSPVLENDQLNGMYVVPNGTGSVVAITDSAAGSPATVTLASSTGITAGESYELRADSAETMNSYLTSPSAISQYRWKVGEISRPELSGARNLLKNPWFRSWSGSDPDSWTVTENAQATTSKNTDGLYTQYGGNSLRIQVIPPNVNGRVDVVSATTYVRPVAGAQFFSLKFRVFLARWSGNAYIQARVIPAGGLFPLGMHTMTPPNIMMGVAGARVAAGDWHEATIANMDLTPALSSGVQIQFVFVSANLIVQPVGDLDVYLDAVSLTQTPSPPSQWVEYSGGNALWHAGNLALSTNKDPLASYEIGVVDRTRMDGTTYPFEDLQIGGTIRDTVPEQGINSVEVRVTGKTINWLVEGDTKVQVATRRQLLGDLFSSSSGATVTIAGAGSGSATAPPTSSPPSGGGGTGGGGSTTTPPPTSTAPPSNSLGSVTLKVPFYAGAVGNQFIWTNQPSSVTEADTGCRTYVDLTNVPSVNMSGRVQTAGHTSAVVATQYLRESDTSWRYLDGTSGPQLSLASTGDIDGAGVRVETDARTRVLIRMVGSGGNATADPALGNIFLNASALSPGTVPTSSAPTDGFDWNPLEGSGTTISDKNGSGVNLTTNGTWVSSGKVRYDHTGTFNFQYARVVDPSLPMVQSSCFMYVTMPPIWSGGAYLGGHQPITDGNTQDRKLIIDPADGKVKVTIKQPSGGSAVQVVSTSTFGVDDEFWAGWTHDGTTLTLYVNGVEEDNAACGDAGYDTPTAFQVAGGLPPLSDQEPPSNGGLFTSTGAVIGRVRAANRGFTAAEVSGLYAEYKTQYPGLP